MQTLEDLFRQTSDLLNRQQVHALQWVDDEIRGQAELVVRVFAGVRSNRSSEKTIQVRRECFFQGIDVVLLEGNNAALPNEPDFAARNGIRSQHRKVVEVPNGKEDVFV